jgi:hypothetical protein
LNQQDLTRKYQRSLAKDYSVRRCFFIMGRIQYFVLIILTKLVFLAVGMAYGATVESSGIWFAGTAQGSLEILSPRLRNYRWWFDTQARQWSGGGTSDQVTIRTGLGYSIMDNTAVWLGYAWNTTSPKGKNRSNENRIWQQLTWSRQFRPVRVSSRTRLEQRFLEIGDDTGWRFRQYLKLSYPLPFETRFSLVGYDEVFINMNRTDWGADRGFSQNRAFLGFGWSFDPNRRMSAEMGYLNQYVHKSSGDDEMSHILAINLFLNF